MAGDQILIQLHYAAGLRNAGAAYCIVRMGARAARTQAVRGSDPCWSEQMTMPYCNEERVLLEVRDETGMLGQAAMSLPSVAEIGGEWAGDLTLYNSKQPVGVINVRVRMSAGQRVILSPAPAVPVLPLVPAAAALGARPVSPVASYVPAPASPVLRCSPSAKALCPQMLGVRHASFTALPQPVPLMTHCASQPLLSPPQPQPLFAAPQPQPLMLPAPMQPLFMAPQPQLHLPVPQPLMMAPQPSFVPQPRLALPPRVQQPVLVMHQPVQSVIVRRQPRPATVAASVYRPQQRQGGAAFGAGLVGGLLLREKL